jgi:hypothetical protein
MKEIEIWKNALNLEITICLTLFWKIGVCVYIDVL